MNRRFMKAIFLFCATVAAAVPSIGAHGQGSRASGDQTAFAVPRIGMPGAGYIGLPQPLSPSDAARIRRIFALQASGAVDEAVRQAKQVETPLLIGAMLADRFLRARPTADEATLADWLARFGDQPDAPAIRALAVHAAEPVSHGKPASRMLRSQPRAPSAANAAVAADQGRDAAPINVMAAGLAAWRLGDAATAYGLFQAAYHVAPDDDSQSAAEFWAARAADQLGDWPGAMQWLRHSARAQGTFYGRIAQRRLELRLTGLATRPDGETLGTAEVASVMATQGGQRAFALLQVGQVRRATAELRDLCLDPATQPLQRHAVALLARAAGITDLLEDPQLIGIPHPTETVALPGLRPNGGFLIDPPLIYAVVQHESNFRNSAVSAAGARGLMQLMPATARAVGALTSLPANHLHDPAVNLALGQQYLLLLADDEAVNGNLLRLLAAYTQGLSGLKRWVDTVRDDGDPLLFLEAMPNPAIRSFVEVTLVHAWRYAGAMHRPAASLDDLAAFKTPVLLRSAAP